MSANNVTRLLDVKKVPYKAFELSAEKRGAAETARLLGVEPDLVYKTIVVTRHPGKPILAVIPGPNRVDLKLLAAALGEKKLSLPTEREAEQLTGLQAGGISPLALINKGFVVVLDAAAQCKDGYPCERGAAGDKYPPARQKPAGTDTGSLCLYQQSRGRRQREGLIGLILSGHQCICRGVAVMGPVGGCFVQEQLNLMIKAGC